MEALDDIRQAFGDNLIDPFLVDMPCVEQFIAEGEAGTLMELSHCPPTGIEDTIAELREWYVFREEPDEPLAPEPRPLPPRPLPWPAAAEPAGLAAEPPLSRGVRVGRNEPCPCGSGKKFKKCCLGKK